MDFQSFLFSIWNYCTLDRNSLGFFVFVLYDKDASGVLGGSLPSPAPSLSARPGARADSRASPPQIGRRCF